MDAKKMANAIRVLAIDAVEAANSGHPGMPMGMADIAQVVWCNIAKHLPEDPTWLNRDRIIISNGHGSMLQYAALFLSGYNLSLDDLKNFRQLGSRTPGHPEKDLAIGIETTTGPLGQGIANAVGIAIAETILADRFNQEEFNIIDHFTYVFAGDGCLMEGVSHEAASLAGTLKLGKLITIWDDNNISIDGETNNWFTDNTADRFKAYGWHVVANVDGHDSVQIEEALLQAKANTTQPSIICCKTKIGYGSDKVAGLAKAHGAPLGKEEVAACKRNLDWPSTEPFMIPESILQAWREKAPCKDAYYSWHNMLLEYKTAHPDSFTSLTDFIAGKLPGQFETAIYNSLDFSKAMSTRQCSGAVIEELAKVLPNLIGGSADLTGSNCTNWTTMQTYRPNKPGNYIHYGVREFGMFAIMNGLALHSNLRPFGGTFVVFSDYGRNAIRLAAMMQTKVTYILTHDSIALGEDGPTHQPIEHVASLRLIPGLNVWRPCDLLETTVAWVESIKGSQPNALILSRQSLPAMPEQKSRQQLIAKGGYILFEPKQSPQVILIATGSEVSLAYNTAIKLTLAGIYVRVVSMPCKEIFLQQSFDWQNKILPKELKVKIAIEAGSSAGWREIVGDSGYILSINTFGASAPQKQVLEHFGFTEENLEKIIKDQLKMTHKTTIKEQ